MKLSTKSVVAASLLFLAALHRSGALVHAQELTTRTTPLGIAYQLHVESGIEIFDGMIVSIGEDAYRESQGAYDRNMFGVLDLNPSIEFTFGNTVDTQPVISDGTAQVMVSGENGPIMKGDIITSSSVPGVGMKATKSGFTLGVAENDFAGETSNDREIIAIRLNKQFTFAEDTPDSETISERLRTVVSLSAIAAFEEPTKVFKYAVAGVVMLISVLVSFATISRAIHQGIEAIGRNPLARSSILIGMFVTIVVSLLIILAGVVGAYIMVTL